MNEKWREEKFDSVYESICTWVKSQREKTKLTYEQLEATLKTEYVNQGNDWIGRGEGMDITIAATIAAYEKELAEWNN